VYVTISPILKTHKGIRKMAFKNLVSNRISQKQTYETSLSETSLATRRSGMLQITTWRQTNLKNMSFVQRASLPGPTRSLGMEETKKIDSPTPKRTINKLQPHSSSIPHLGKGVRECKNKRAHLKIDMMHSIREPSCTLSLRHP